MLQIASRLLVYLVCLAIYVDESMASNLSRQVSCYELVCFISLASLLKLGSETAASRRLNVSTILST
ncbi:hypothetical protein AVEN_227933-1 [Araneus ventricosus]|uniref:Secreted protein n=1 Tax=Araneus ventricosus TaxID=182803 RepID=A0A4Y2S1D4_ARAVE|nr:hypothetical protein AVEN_227933-1 [Araneus ventricosus]